MKSLNAKVRLGTVVGLLTVTAPFAVSGANTPIARAATRVTSFHLTPLRTTTFPSGGIDAAAGDSASRPPAADTDAAPGKFPINVNRTLGVSKGQGAVGVGASTAKSNPNLIQSFDGLTSYQEAAAAPGGNFIFEPPDQALCAGNGYVIDGVNDAMSVYTQAGATRVAGPTTLNGFLGIVPEISSGGFGPRPTDPSCYYDSATQRFFFSMLTLNLASDGSWDGGNELDLAVSNTNNPTGNWTIYRIDVTGDGASGCPCLGDFPRIGADANGVYITTDDFSLVTNGYNGAQIYALSKQGLESGNNLNGWRFDTSGMVTGDGGYKVIPAASPGGNFETSAGGTEYFLSSTFDNCATCTTSDNRVAVWALTQTSNLAGPNPPSLSNTLVTISPYADPPNGTQKSGDHPYGEVNYSGRPVGVIATNDAGNLTTYFANGKLWGALNTSVQVGGVTEVGIAYYIITPTVVHGTVQASLALQGTLASSNGNVMFPTIAVTQSGRGVMAYTLSGPNDYPTAAYSSLDVKAGAGPITVAAAGVGPQDGFSEYDPYYANGDPRPRWGDYGASAVDGNNIWFASEYIGQTCNVAAYIATPGRTCSRTRTAYSNWDTRITEVNM